jgi:hypothetical protein
VVSHSRVCVTLTQSYLIFVELVTPTALTVSRTKAPKQCKRVSRIGEFRVLENITSNVDLKWLCFAFAAHTYRGLGPRGWNEKGHEAWLI